MQNVFDTRLYVGAVSHRRLRPVSHRFAYKIFSILINIDEAPDLDRSLRWFTHNRLGLISFMDKDHGPKDGSPLRPWVIGKLRAGGYEFEPGSIKLLCFPRLFGFVFNPLSIWYCYDTAEKLRAVLYEVRNTFGEWRGYLLPVNRPEGSSARIVRQTCRKTFYVSPLMEMNCDYHFSLSEPGETLTVGIRETREGERILLAAQTGKSVPFTDKNIFRTFLSHPLMYFKIVAGIHWEAFRTLVKGAKFYANPQTKTGDVTYPDQR